MGRRMIGPPTPVGQPESYHDLEHDWDWDCDNDPPCSPVNKDATYDPPPPHYDSGAGLDPWAVVDAFGLGFYDGNVLKYLLRAGKKDIAPRLDDLKKARNYLNKLIELEER